MLSLLRLTAAQERADRIGNCRSPTPGPLWCSPVYTEDCYLCTQRVADGKLINNRKWWSSNVESIGRKFAEDLGFRVHVSHRTGLRAGLLKHRTLPDWLDAAKLLLPHFSATGKGEENSSELKQLLFTIVIIRIKPVTTHWQTWRHGNIYYDRKWLLLLNIVNIPLSLKANGFLLIWNPYEAFVSRV